MVERSLDEELEEPGILLRLDSRDEMVERALDIELEEPGPGPSSATDLTALGKSSASPRSHFFICEMILFEPTHRLSSSCQRI